MQRSRDLSSIALSYPVHGFKEFCSLSLIGSKIDSAAGTLCITVLTNTETIISSNMICISAVHIIFIIVLTDDHL